MRETVVIPSCHRPELLALCLLALSGAPDCPEVHIYADTAAKIDEIEYVRDQYFPTATIFHAKPHISAPSGCWNILNSIKEGAKWADAVYIVEEDVRIYPETFFEWHRSRPEAASCGRRMLTHPNFPYYTTPGSPLRRPLLDALLPHIRDEYFADTVAYCEENFPPADWTSTLDDGLIRRVLTQAGFDWHIPEKAVCAHQGFRNYNKLDIFMNEGTDVEERIGRFLQLCEFIPNATDPRFKRYAADFEPFNPSSSTVLLGPGNPSPCQSLGISSSPTGTPRRKSSNRARTRQAGESRSGRG